MSKTEQAVRARISNLQEKIEKSQKTEDELRSEIGALQCELQNELEERQFISALLRELLQIGAEAGILTEGNGVKIPPKKKASAAVLDYLRMHPSGATSSRIADDLKDLVDTQSDNKRSIIFSAVFNLKKNAKIVFDEDTEKYSLPKKTDDSQAE